MKQTRGTVSFDQVSLFLALLAVVAQVGGLVLVGAALFPRARAAVRAAVGPVAMSLAAAVAATCTAGSLYFSEIADFPPCRLCWYQRIAMYPLVPLLALAAWRRDAAARIYASPLVIAGAAIATYHVVLERVPSLESGACELANPCTIIWVERLGYLTIPTMALTGFVVIGLLLAYTTRESR
jgi:disulfide bond formation protein DsbB